MLNPDVDAKKLAVRFDGLPLALATAGDYISQTADSFGDYLHMYEQNWTDLAENSDGLMEYDDRTLYSTWNLSLKQVAVQDPQAEELFRLMGYLGNADLWYELFRKGAGSAPDWFCDITKSKARFNKGMAILHRYSLIETMPGYYSLHACVHDWVLEYLIRKVDITLFGLAMHCVAQNVVSEFTPEYWLTNSRLNHHAFRIKRYQQREGFDWNVIDMEDIYRMGYLDSMMGRLKEAEAMYKQALKKYEKAWGAEHTSTLDIVNNLGILYYKQNKITEAEAMYIPALNGKEKTWGAEHTSSLAIVNNLGVLYADQSKMAEAEEMLLRALKGYEKIWGTEYTPTLGMFNNLGLLYYNQNKIVEAEEMYMQALKGKEKTWGPEHTSTLDTVNNLGNLYSHQSKMVEAEKMYIRALKGKEKICGAEHTSTLDIINNLGNLYSKQGKMDEGEKMLLRALKKKEKVWGAEHTSTLDIVNNLGLLYINQGKMAEAERMFLWALKGYEKTWGAEHTSTLKTVKNLGNLYKNQGKMAKAEAMYQNQRPNQPKVAAVSPSPG